MKKVIAIKPIKVSRVTIINPLSDRTVLFSLWLLDISVLTGGDLFLSALTVLAVWVSHFQLSEMTNRVAFMAANKTIFLKSKKYFAYKKFFCKVGHM
jgi:hypothetical protein